jgi:hypothetical protein
MLGKQFTDPCADAAHRPHGNLFIGTSTAAGTYRNVHQFKPMSTEHNQMNSLEQPLPGIAQGRPENV